MTLSAATISWVRRLAFVLALGAVAMSLLGRRLDLLEFRPGGSSYDTAVRPAFLALFVVALLVAVRWAIFGGIVAGFAAAGLVAFAANQLEPRSAVLVVGAFALPAILWVLIDLHEASIRRAGAALGAAALVAAGGYVVGDRVYAEIWGPTHPASVVERLDDSPVEWVWSGGVTTDAAIVRAKGREAPTSARLALSADDDLASVRWVEARELGGEVVAFALAGLEPDTRYHYRVELDGVLDTTRTGTLRTFPAGRASFDLAFGSCARVGSNGRVFDTIRELDPLVYTILGDFHYGDTDVDDIGEYQAVLDTTLTQPGQAALYRSVPVSYVWDDHDYGANDSDGASLSRTAALASYREYVPSYELASDDSAIFQAFTVGRVRVILTDARSARDPRSWPDDENKSMLGEQQRAWFEREVVEASQTHAAVVWVNPVPWVAAARPGADHWGGYSTERQRLADHLADHEVDNLVMVSGDAHMVAIDDGTNTNFSSRPGDAFPLLHAAALDRRGGTKGGPYSEGAIPGGGQFGVLEIDDAGDEIVIDLVARDWEGAELLRHQVTFPVDGGLWRAQG